MSIRTTIAEKPAVAIVFAAIACLVCIGLIVWELPASRSHVHRLKGQAFYSDNDGRSWFLDAADKLPPFDHHGKLACRAVLYRCGSGKPFVAYLEKYSPQQFAQLAFIAKSASARGLSTPPRGMNMLMEIKKPGNSRWISDTSAGENYDPAEYNKLLAPRCPDGSPARRVLPYESDIH